MRFNYDPRVEKLVISLIQYVELEKYFNPLLCCLGIFPLNYISKLLSNFTNAFTYVLLNVTFATLVLQHRSHYSQYCFIRCKQDEAVLFQGTTGKWISICRTYTFLFELFMWLRNIPGSLHSYPILIKL